MIRKQTKEIRQFILREISVRPTSVINKVVEKYGISRQAVSRHISELVKEGKVRADGRTRNRSYELIPTVLKEFSFRVEPGLSEDRIWLEKVKPILTDLPSNILDICNYGITEIVNNVFDHSESRMMRIYVVRNPVETSLTVIDTGVGIFNKIKSYFNMHDVRQAFLELAKGKLTTNSERHTGEGIFFTSRMFDDFRIISGAFMFAHTRHGESEDDWLTEDMNRGEFKGTLVNMTIFSDSVRTTNQVFNKYASELNEYGFSKTHVPVTLAQYEGEKLISRSQAKRLLARFESFREVWLDFNGVKDIGQAFADEIFRVFSRSNPETKIVYVNANPDVERMILRAQKNVLLSTEEISHQLNMFKID